MKKIVFYLALVLTLCISGCGSEYLICDQAGNIFISKSGADVNPNVKMLYKSVQICKNNPDGSITVKYKGDKNANHPN